MSMPDFEPSPSLKSRTFLGLLVAQFLAAFNDQAIHASAMFFAIHKNTLTEAKAISLMPILFYAPWAMFCTLAGYLADRYSKRNSLVFWKVAEIGITLIALAGFWLGSALTNCASRARGSCCPPSSSWARTAPFSCRPSTAPCRKSCSRNLLSQGNGILESTVVPGGHPRHRLRRRAVRSTSRTRSISSA